MLKVAPDLRCKIPVQDIYKHLNRGLNVGCDFPPSLAQTKDARGIYASSSNASPSLVTISCNLLVHLSSLSMERCSTDVPGSQRNVSMHGRVIGPILMLEMQGTCAVQELGLGQSIPRVRHCRGLPSLGLASLDNTCENFHDKVYMKV